MGKFDSGRCLKKENVWKALGNSLSCCKRKYITDSKRYQHEE
jgi:hypothetical protein